MMQLRLERYRFRREGNQQYLIMERKVSCEKRALKSGRSLALLEAPALGLLPNTNRSLEDCVALRNPPASPTSHASVIINTRCVI